jgi:hypothetical protein
MLKSWADEYLEKKHVILERAAQTATFSKYLLARARADRKQDEPSGGQ